MIVRADLDLAPTFSVLVSAYSWLREQVAGVPETEAHGLC